jgi:glycolate oxidase iron-sulfur subunit
VTKRLHRKFIFEAFTKPERLQFLRWPLLIYQKSGLQKALRASGVFKVLPKSVGAMDALMPNVQAVEGIAHVTAAKGEKRRRVGLILGCVQQTFFSHVNAATVRVLAAEGCEVVAPPGQSCCGALFVHSGEEACAQERARKTIDAFEEADVETIVINAAGCGSTVKEYGHLLRDDPSYAERAKRFSAKCRDASEFLAELSPRAERKVLAVRAAFHDSCHLQNAQGIRVQPRALLTQIPGLELFEIPESSICCGSAGIYNLVQPGPARELGERKARHIAGLKPDVVATGNPGCLLQLKASLKGLGHDIPVVHTIQLLDASIRGLSPDTLR